MKYYVADAFAEKIFEGNPAGICVLEDWPSERLMQEIAIENNLSETAFVVREESGYHLRWFTPGGEIDLCGHATLATAFILFRFYEPEAEEITFQTQSGLLTVARKNGLYEMDFPAYPLEAVPVTDAMADAVGVRPVEAWLGRDLVCVLETAEQVISAQPNQEKLLSLDGLLFHLTAKGTEYDCVSRSFAPKLKVTEDPVCGSGHCHLVPLWAGKLGKQDILARQASRRGGTLYCRMDGERVRLAGKAALYSEAELFIPEEKPL